MAGTYKHKNVNPYKRLAQTQKALAISALLVQYDIPLEDAELIDQDGWQKVAEAAGFRSVSAETSALVLSMLEPRFTRPQSTNLYNQRAPGARARTHAANKQ